MRGITIGRVGELLFCRNMGLRLLVTIEAPLRAPIDEIDKESRIQFRVLLVQPPDLRVSIHAHHFVQCAVVSVLFLVVVVAKECASGEEEGCLGACGELGRSIRSLGLIVHASQQIEEVRRASVIVVFVVALLLYVGEDLRFGDFLAEQRLDALR